MNINNINASIGPIENRNARVDSGSTEKPNSSGPHFAGKLPPVLGQPTQTKATELLKQFSEAGESRPEVVQDATEKLNNGHFNNRQVIVDTANTLFGIRPSS